MLKVKEQINSNLFLESNKLSWNKQTKKTLGWQEDLKKFIKVFYMCAQAGILVWIFSWILLWNWLKTKGAFWEQKLLAILLLWKHSLFNRPLQSCFFSASKPDWTLAHKMIASCVFSKRFKVTRPPQLHH